MILHDPGWLRPVLAFVLAVLGVLLRFVLPSSTGGFGLRTFRTRPDDDLLLRVRGWTGTYLLLWAGWLVFQVLVAIPESKTAVLWAPLGLLVLLLPASFARLYVLRHLPGSGTLATGFRAWVWVVLRETAPLGAMLAVILVARSVQDRLPPEIPIGWDWRTRDFSLIDRDTGLRILRHRTMWVYLALLGIEGTYLMARWAMGRGVDIARAMLSRGGWLYYLFKTGWVILFAGFNLALLEHARGSGSAFLAVLPGLAILCALGLLIARGR